MLLLDHNLSLKLIRLLGDEFGQVEHVDALEMAASSDTDIWEYAKNNGYTIVTKDKDFYQRSTIFGLPPKVIHLTLGNSTVQEAAAVIMKRSGHVKEFLNHESKAYLVLP